MSNIVFGKPLSDKFTEQLKFEFSKLPNLNSKKIVIIQIGDDAGSTKYIQLKTKKAKEFGINLEHLKYEISVSEFEILAKITELNIDENVIGIMIQSPVVNLDLETLCNAIIPSKDFDGMGKDAIVLPAVDVGILKILEYIFEEYLDGKNSPYPTQIPLPIISGLTPPFPEKGDSSYLQWLKKVKVCIVNDSIILGKPLAKYLMSIGCHVNVCNKYTPDISLFTKEADILISGTGVAGLITSEIVKPGVIAVDCGFPTGDCDESVFQKAKAITPVPGGVGPLTVTCLFENLLTLIKNK